MEHTWTKPVLAGLATLAALGLAAVTPTASLADSPYATVTVTGFNAPVVQTTQGQAVNYVDANVQLVLANVDVANSYAKSTGGGLPDGGAITVAAGGADAGAPFQLGNGPVDTYVGNDALQLSTNPALPIGKTGTTQAEVSSDTLTLGTPGQYSNVGILWMSGYGPSLADVQFNYVGGGTTLFQSQTVLDWGANPPVGTYKAVHMGRIDLTPGSVGAGRSNGGSQAIYTNYFAVDPSQILKSITFTDDQDSATNPTPSGNGMMTVFAVNGIAAAPEPGEIVALMLGGLGLLGLIAKKRKAIA